MAGGSTKIKKYLTFPIMKELTNIEYVCNILGYDVKYNHPNLDQKYDHPT